MLLTGAGAIDAERAFDRATRGRWRAALGRLVRPKAAAACRLPVYDERRLHGSAPTLPGIGGVSEIPLAAITGTLEPTRASLFDCAFRPAAAARRRWERVWLAEHRGTVLPPISVARVGAGYAVRDGHHRVSVARARGAVTIDAIVDALQPS